ncbi:MAG: GAF domain-containing protein [Anaerolineae bacterium]|nr:GAF domain-containing protein [Anaerolineae bacterium]
MPAKKAGKPWPNKVLVGLQDLVADMIAELDLHVVLHKVVQHTAELVGADIATIHIYEPLTGFVRAAAGIGLLDKDTFQQHIPNRGKVALLVVNQGAPIIAEDVSASELAGPFTKREHVKSAAGFPLKVRDEVIGVLFVSYRKPHQFTSEEVETLTSFGHLAAIAINSASLLEKANVRASAIRKINEVGQSLLAVRDVQPLLKRIAQVARDVLGADIVVLYEYFTETGDIRVPPVISGELSQPEVLETTNRARPHKESAVFRMLERVDPFYAPNAEEDWAQVIKGWAPQEGGLGGFIHREKITSSAAVRLVAENVPVGVLFANYKTPRVFLEEERNIIELFAIQAAIAIQNARLLHRESALRQQSETLREVAAAISSVHELNELAGKILDELHKVVEYRKATMQLIQGDKRTLIAFRGFGPEAIDEWLLRPVSEDRLVSRIVGSQEPCILSQLPDDTQEDWEVRPETANIKSWAGVPVVYRGEVIGFLTLDHDQSGFYTQDLKPLLVAFANQAASAIENALLLERRIRDLGIINTVGQIISTKLDYQDLLQTIVSQLAEKLNCTHCTLFFPKKIDGETLLVPQVTHGSRAEVLTRRFQPGEGLLGWVYQHGESLVSPNVRQDSRFAAARDPQDRPRSMLVAPVKVGSRTIGVISADQDEHGWFSESDQRLAEALAQQAGIAIERAVGLRLLHDVGNRMIGVQQVDEVLQQVVKGALELTHTTSGVIYLISQDGKSVTQSFQYPPDFDHPKPRLDRGSGITRQVLETGETTIFFDIRQDTRVNEILRERGILSMIAVPLKLGQEVTGVLYLNDTEPHEFTETELSLLSTLANQAAVAIQSVRALEQSRQQADELALLHQVGAQLMTLDLEKLLQLIVQGALRLTKTEFGSIYLLSDDGATITDTVVFPASFSDPRAPVSKKGLTRLIFDTGDPAFVLDASQDARVNPEIVKLGIRSFIGQPLKIGTKVIGVLYLNDTTLREFSESQNSLVSALADQAAVAIYNARLFKDSQRLSKGHETLNSVGTELIGTLDEKEILRHVACSAANTLDCTQVTVFRVEEEQLVVQTSQGDRDWSFQEGRVFRLGQGLAGAVAQTGQPLLVKDARQNSAFEPSWSYPEPDPESLVIVPILVDKEVYGVISVEQNRKNAFDEQDRRLLETLASQVSQAVRNARLFETRRRLESQLERLHQVVQEQNLSMVLDRIVEGIADILGEGTSPTINLYSEKTGKFSQCHACGPLRKELEVPPRQKGTGRYVVKTGEALYLDDVLNPPPGCPTVRRASTEKMGIKSFAAIPLKRQDEIVGVLFVNIQRSLSFSPEVRRVLELFAGQAAIAIHVSQYLERNIRELKALTEIGGTVSDLGVDQILDLVYEKMGEIIDLRDAQVQVAFYEETKDEVTFPLAVEQDKGVTIDVVRWSKREPAYMVPGENEVVEQFKPRARRVPPGLNEYVIRAKKPLLIVKDFEAKAAALGIQVWPTFGRKKRTTDSWLGVPMIVHGRVVGVISIQSLEYEYAFDQGHVTVLRAIANQVAVAVENARLYEQRTEAWQQAQKEAAVAERQRAEAEKWAYLGKIAGSLAHRIGNKGGMIRLCVQDLEALISELDLPHDTFIEVTEHLDTIRRNNQYLLKLSNFLFKPRKAIEETRGEVDVRYYLDDALKYADLPADVRVERQYEAGLPLVRGNKYLVEVFLELVVNAVDAMKFCSDKVLSITASRANEQFVDVRVHDSGPGIGPLDQQFIFELFAQASEGKLADEGHQGFGLWWVRVFLWEIGGDIWLESEPGSGCTFTVHLPVAEDDHGQ